MMKLYIPIAFLSIIAYYIVAFSNPGFLKVKEDHSGIYYFCKFL